MNDPVRLLSSGPPDVQDLLRSAKADAPSGAQLQQLASRLAPMVTAAPAAASATLLPWVFAGVAILGAAGVAVLGRDRDHVQPAPVVAARIESPPVKSVEVPTPPVVHAPTPEPVSEPVRVAPKKKRKVAAPAAPAIEPTPEPVQDAPPVAATEPPPAPPREMELLTPAHAALSANDPKRALALAERHASLYASGTFAEEREAIAIEALHRLGQRVRARTRFAAFTARYPRSSYRGRLDRTIRE